MHHRAHFHLQELTRPVCTAYAVLSALEMSQPEIVDALADPAYTRTVLNGARAGVISVLYKLPK